MRISTIVAALTSAIAVSALPTASSLVSRIETCDKSPSDGRAATLFKQQNLIGENVATDYTPLPADSGCIDMSSFFGNWEGKTRSLVVNAGFKCEFYTEFKCPADCPKLALGSKTAQALQKTLPEAFDERIYSAKCTKF
ncbi:hypothetical protein BU26DRAFT_568108 [Trematosphaeria pertusa]|uniref:Uncharacterized protein n=1 Tax=Trematosphaeria pertusa TaxID=390896 RepID=A0A6A6I7M1_9PLEO|nr:uncharacterized protein BU26DRAFT_568108 [Trematosphaeria pertusa]KAF2245533.1 hypothetical protein BU26DRAFT_568108 [Trematosphaeria pertusa]